MTQDTDAQAMLLLGMKENSEENPTRKNVGSSRRMVWRVAVQVKVTVKTEEGASELKGAYLLRQ